jgi:hypothetical protein
MKMSEVLRKAKPKLYKERFLCHAICATNADGFDKRKTADYVQSLLGNNFTVDDWLHYEKGISDELLTDKNMLAYRKRWVDHLIAELEKEGE